MLQFHFSSNNRKWAVPEEIHIPTMEEIRKYYSAPLLTSDKGLTKTFLGHFPSLDGENYFLCA